jgi:bacterioferritin
MNSSSEQEITRERLVELLNEDLSREYQAIIAYTIFSQKIKGAQYMQIAKELEAHALEELEHARMLSKQIDYFGGEPTSVPKAVKKCKTAKEMLQADLDNENETVRNYRERIRQAEALSEFGLANDLRKIIRDEQDHQIDLATALDIEIPKAGFGSESAQVHTSDSVSAT